MELTTSTFIIFVLTPYPNRSGTRVATLRTVPSPSFKEMDSMSLRRYLPVKSVSALILLLLTTLLLTTVMKTETQEKSINFEAKDLVFNGTPAEDPVLVEYVRKMKLVPPSNKPYNLKNPNAVDVSQYGQPKIYEKLLHNKTGGFFVEVGAFDGEALSNSLYFERFRGWSGLLIEANNKLYDALQTKNRKAYSIHAGLSLHPYAEVVSFIPAGFVGRITSAGRKGVEALQCFPFYTLMLALGRNHIDLLSLDIEGDELNMLKTIPWDKFQITLLDVEVAHIKEGKQAVIDYMTSVGYTFIQQHRIDYIFAKKELLDKIPK